MEHLLSVCLGIGLSASTGFRIFVPMLVANIAVMAGWITPTEGFTWLGTWSAFVVFATAAVAEVFAYYIPFVDNLLDSIAVPASVVAGTLLTTSFVELNNPLLQWGLGLIVGGGTAGLVQAGTSILRLASSKTTAGLGNPVVATTENVASVGLAALAVFLPILGGILVIILVGWLLRVWGKFRSR